MISSTLNLRLVLPRMLTEKEAAAYCGLPVKRFPSATRIAPVSMPTGKTLYDRHDCDSYIDQLKQGGVEADDDVIGKLG